MGCKLHYYIGHLHVQANRDLEESLRTTSPFDIERPVLFIMTDGMEQSKWAIPRSHGIVLRAATSCP